MARSLSLLRRRPGVVDIGLQARAGAKSYQFFASSNWDSAGVAFQVVPASGGYRSPGVPDISVADGQFRGITRFLFSPSDYGSTFQVASLVLLSNQLRQKYEAHRTNGGGVWHTNPDTTNTIAAPAATDTASAITLLNDIKTKYAAHRVLVGGGPVHSVADTVNIVTAANATDFATAVVLADDLKAKFNAHRSQATVHALNDTSNAVAASDGSLDDTGPFYLSIQQTSWDGTVGPVEAKHMVMPYNSAPDRPVILRGTAPTGTSITDSVEVHLPMQCQNLVFQASAAAAYVAFEPNGPEFRVPAISEGLDVSLVYPVASQLFMRGDSTTTTIQVVTSLRNNPRL